METYPDIEGLAKYLVVAEKTVRKWVLNDNIPYHKIMKVIRFWLSEIERWVEGGGKFIRVDDNEACEELPVAGEVVFKPQKGKDPKENYRIMVETAKAFVEEETDLIALLSNLSALIKVYVEDLNWAGFYLLKGSELVLGPFQGLPACTRIGAGKGVCGEAALKGKIVIVDDVHQFPGHIACDSASISEMVIPFFKDERVFGVLDLDSPLPARFSSLEAEYLGELASLITVFLDG